MRRRTPTYDNHDCSSGSSNLQHTLPRHTPPATPLTVCRSERSPITRPKQRRKKRLPSDPSISTILNWVLASWSLQNRR